MNIRTAPFGRLCWHNLIGPGRLKQLAGGAALLALGLLVALAPLEMTLALLIGGGLALLVLCHPVIGLGLLALILPFSQVRQVSLAGAQVGLAEALLALTLAAWLLRMAARREVRVSHPPLLLPFLALIGVQLLSLLASRSLRESLPELLKWVEMLLVYLFVASQVRPRHVPWIVAAMLLAGSAQALLGAYQFLRQVGPEAFVLLGRFMRAYGTFSQPNPYAGYLGLIAPLALSLALWALGRVWDGLRQGPRRLPADMIRRWATLGFFGAAMVLLIAGMGMSWSRGAWLGLAAAVVVVGGLRSRRAALGFALLAIVVCIFAILGRAGVLPGALGGRLAGLGEYVQYATDPNLARVEITDANFAVLERVAHWRAAWAMFSDHPWLGVGIGNYAVAYSAYSLPHWRDALGHAHNIYLHVLAETGLLGLAAYLIFWVVAIVRIWQARAPQNDYAKAVAIGVLGVIAHLTVHNLVDNLYVQGMYLHVAILLGLPVVGRFGTADPLREATDP
ncbi:MAG: O-antigen ligase family protein [Anaerolineae bacterium]|nr:O-antigen ligase family protein [Anaerolineae bacterium]